MINSPVLVLNQNYEPLDVCRARRAVVLIWRGKAEMLEKNSGMLNSATMTIPIPSVIRLVYMIKRPRTQRKMSRREVFLRDNHTCQYCGRQTRELTIDHVTPRRLGGRHTWDNVVSACKTCNQRKAGRSPRVAGMDLMRQPCPPATVGYHIVFHRFDEHPEWHKYIPHLGN
jgi:5-methylcytosine-specific restriction endonuclease McrA